jgi:hypothetical protein
VLIGELMRMFQVLPPIGEQQRSQGHAVVALSLD